MRIKSYQWLDDHLVGGVKIECDCGHVFEIDSLDGEHDADSIVECPECHRIEKFRISVSFIFEKI